MFFLREELCKLSYNKVFFWELWHFRWSGQVVIGKLLFNIFFCNKIFIFLYQLFPLSPLALPILNLAPHLPSNPSRSFPSIQPTSDPAWHWFHILFITHSLPIIIFGSFTLPFIPLWQLHYTFVRSGGWLAYPGIRMPGSRRRRTCQVTLSLSWWLSLFSFSVFVLGQGRVEWLYR